MAGRVRGYSKAGQQVAGGRRDRADRQGAVRLARRREARPCAGRARRRSSREGLPRRRRLDRRLHGLPAPTRRPARDRARRRLRAARPEAARRRARDRARAGERARADRAARSRPSWSSATSPSSASGWCCRRRLRWPRRAGRRSRWSSRSSRPGKEEVGKGGVVRDPEIRRRVVREIAEASLALACAGRRRRRLRTTRTEGKPRDLHPARQRPQAEAPGRARGVDRADAAQVSRYAAPR